MEPTTYVTRHAKKRIKQRMHKSWQKASDDAYANGLRHGDLTGELRRHVDGLHLRARSFGDERHRYIVHKGYIFIFDGTTLITVTHLPRQLIKAAQRLTEQRKQEHANRNKQAQ